MEQERTFDNITGIVLKLVVLGTLILSGCSSYCGVNKDSDFDSKGLPNQKYLVGGGFDIYWIAPVDGTLYIVAESNGTPPTVKRLLVTKAYKSGEDFKFDKDSITKLISQPIPLKYSLYFIPWVKSQTEPASK